MKTIRIKKEGSAFAASFLWPELPHVFSFTDASYAGRVNFNPKLGHKEFIVCPILRIGLNVIRNSLKRIVVADNVIVKTRLPGKIRMNLSRIKDTSAFILVDNDA